MSYRFSCRFQESALNLPDLLSRKPKMNAFYFRWILLPALWIAGKFISTFLIVVLVLSIVMLATWGMNLFIVVAVSVQTTGNNEGGFVFCYVGDMRK